MPLQFSYGNLSVEEVRAFLWETNGEFPTPLSAHVDIDSYAKKLSEYSDFAICRNGESIIGMISCYTNQPPLGYISNVCVKKRFQGRKVFSRLFLNLLTNVQKRGIHFLRLEVDRNNIDAISVYTHYGFQRLEALSNSVKIPMELTIGHGADYSITQK